MAFNQAVQERVRTMIEARNISVSHGRKTILSDVTCNISGGVHCILGQNGAGKSTLLKCLSGGISYDRGQVMYDGQDLKTRNIRELAKKRAVLDQNLEIEFPFKAIDIVMMGRSPFIASNKNLQDVEVAELALHRLEAYGLKDRIYLSLSGGEKQRIQMARVLAQLHFSEEDLSGKILFLDEPMSALDVKHQRMCLELIDELRSKGLCVVCVMHDINISCEIADHLLFLKEGALIARHNVKTSNLNESVLVDTYDTKPVSVIRGDSGKTFYHF